EARRQQEQADRQAARQAKEDARKRQYEAEQLKYKQQWEESQRAHRARESERVRRDAALRQQWAADRAQQDAVIRQQLNEIDEQRKKAAADFAIRRAQHDAENALRNAEDDAYQRALEQADADRESEFQRQLQQVKSDMLSLANRAGRAQQRPEIPLLSNPELPN